MGALNYTEKQTISDNLKYKLSDSELHITKRGTKKNNNISFSAIVRSGVCVYSSTNYALLEDLIDNVNVVFGFLSQCNIDSACVYINSDTSDGNIIYRYRLYQQYEFPWGNSDDYFYNSSDFNDIGSLIYDVSNNRVDYSKLRQECDDSYICGYRIYGFSGNYCIYILDEKYKLYSYPNGDIAIFYDNKKYVLATDMRLYDIFKTTDKYKNNYDLKSNSGCLGVYLLLVGSFVSIITLLL